MVVILLCMEKKPKKILIGEDEKPVSKAMSLKLSKSGFDVVPAYNGEEVLEKLKSDSFDLVLLDIMMPKVDGFAVMEELNKKGNKIPVIVTTNLGQNEDIKRMMELGATNYFVKSNTPISKIVEYVEKALNL